MPTVIVDGVRYWVYKQDPTDDPRYDRCILLKVGGVSFMYDSIVRILEVTW